MPAEDEGNEVTEQVVIEKPVCAKCGDQLSGRGTANAEGARYCQKRACRTARDRAAYAKRRAQDDVPMETRDCVRCGASLPARPRRVTDSPLGRWCRKNTCQAARREALSPAGIERARVWYEAVTDLEAKFQSAVIEPCDDCGFSEGRVGFMHRDMRPDSITGWCFAQGDLKRQPIPAGHDEAFGPGGLYADS